MCRISVTCVATPTVSGLCCWRTGWTWTGQARELSKGNRQKLAVVLAMMSGPELLVLGEPTSGLDPIVQQEFHALLREQTAAGGCVFLSSHVLGEVQRVADRIGVVRAGRLIAVEGMTAPSEIVAPCRGPFR